MDSIHIALSISSALNIFFLILALIALAYLAPHISAFQRNINKIEIPSIIFIAIIILIIVLPTNYFLAKSLSYNPGEFGDIFGASNAVFSGFAFIGLIYTILQQTKILESQNKSIENQINLSLFDKRISLYEEIRESFEEKNKVSYIERVTVTEDKIKFLFSHDLSIVYRQMLQLKDYWAPNFKGIFMELYITPIIQLYIGHEYIHSPLEQASKTERAIINKFIVEIDEIYKKKKDEIKRLKIRISYHSHPSNINNVYDSEADDSKLGMLYEAKSALEHSINTLNNKIDRDAT